eukprot:TRINITY_DN16532_c0_g1_i7.p1 TRINITY_DN16532_c0_g1~~TRINITY_DN16532_c0_g1_i7.p1  ORF type:complete len:1416 (+),score=180.93 TRINITY_DN16532_c0_g1_i7:478-4248(+)
MQRSLDTLGDLPDFRGGQEKLEAYRKRLQDHVESALSTSLQARRSERVRELWELMSTIKRGEAAEALYVNVRAVPLIQIWNSLERAGQQEQRGGSGMYITPHHKVEKFMNQLVTDLDSEQKWVEAVLPDLHVSLLQKLIRSVFMRIQKGFQFAVDQSVEGAEGVISAMALQKSASLFAGKVFGEFLNESKVLASVAQLAQQLTDPFLSVMDYYGKLEIQYLTAQIQQLVPSEVVSDEDMDFVHSQLRKSAENVFAILDGTRERCSSFTKCIGAGVVYEAVDEVLAGFLSSVSVVVDSVFNRYNQLLGQDKKQVSKGPRDELDELDAGDQTPMSPTEISEDLTAVLQLLLFSEWLSQRLSLLEGQLRNLIPRLKTLLEDHVTWKSQTITGDIVDPRLMINSDKEFDFVKYVLSSGNEALEKLQDLVRVGSEARFMALPDSYKGVKTLGSQIDDSVYSLLIAPVNANVKGMASMPLWRQEEEDNAFQLPSFSGYPQLISGLCGQDIAQISAGLRHSLVLTRDQKLFAFGNNESGQIGLCQDNPTIPNPTIVPGFDGLLILFAAAMGDHNMAVVQQISNDKTNSVDGQLISGPLPSGRLQGRACLPHELPLLLEIISEANSTGEFGYLNRVVEDVFSSPGLLLAGFQNIHNTQENKQDHNLDLNAINAIYAKLINPDNPKIIIHLGQACLRILYQIQALLDDEKVDMFMCMRLLLILIQNPFNMQQHILEEERLGPQLLLLYYGVIRQLQQDQRSFNTFCEWLREIPPEVFGRDLVKATQENIIHVVQNQSWRVARQGIRSMLNILRVFYDVSTMGGKDLIPFSRFHNEIVCKASSAQIEYQHWKQANEWSLLEYPFILTAEAKSQYVQYEAFIQQQFQFQQSQFQAFISGGGLLRMASIGFFTVSIRRSDVMRDALTKILNSNPHDFKKKLRVKFVSNGVEEEGQDEGGLTKEFFQLLTRDLFDVQYGMYSYDYETRTYWFNSMDLDAEQRLEFELVGILFGLAIYNGVLLDVHFPLVVYKKLLGQTPTFEDLKQAFPQLGKGLQQLLEFDGDVENTFMRDFTIQQSVFGEVITKELKPGGANIPVTSENRQEYVDLYTQFLLTDSIKPHFVAFSVGFKKVCDLSPQGVLSLLRAEELEQLVCGLPHLDFKALEQNTRYDGGYTYDHPAIKMFWEIVGQFTLSQKKKFLAFTTGSDRSPVGGLGTMRFIVQRGGPDTEKLPTSHTCFNILLLPQYSSKDKMRQKLLTAIENAEGFGLR